MRQTISLRLDELDGTLVQHIKSMFSRSGKQRVTIIVDDEIDETDYLLQSDTNRERLLRSLDNAQRGNFVSSDLTTFRTGADA